MDGEWGDPVPPANGKPIVKQIDVWNCNLLLTAHLSVNSEAISPNNVELAIPGIDWSAIMVEDLFERRF